MSTLFSQNFRATVDKSDLASIKAVLHGEAILPGDAEYETVRRVWNGAIDRHPALIIRCADADDVLRAIEFARQKKLEIAVRGGGHNPSGFSTCDGGVVIDLSPMNAVRVNPQDQSARAEGGVLIGELIQAAEKHDLVTPTGTVSDVGIGGLTLGGGVGWLVGKYGLTCDNVRSFDVVTADSRLIKANANENPDLYWGLRGGGGNFGVVTAFEYQLHPAKTILGGKVVHPLSRAREVLRFYRELVNTSPDELTAVCGILTDPDGTPGIAIGVCYCGDLTEGERVVAPLRKFGPPLVDLIQPMPYSGLFAMLDPAYRRGRCDFMKGNGVMAFEDEVIDLLVNSALRFTSPFSQILILPVHGAASRIETGEMAFAFREKHIEILHVAAWEGDGGENHMRWMWESWNDVQPFASQLGYVNFMADEGMERIRAAYGPNYERLAVLKNKFDPHNVFHLNQNIRPKFSAR